VRSVVLFEDETDLLLLPPLRAAWTLRGKPAHVPITGVNAKRVVWGVLNVLTGYRLLWESAKQRAEDFCDFLEIVSSHFRGWHVALLLDSDSSHTAGISQDEADELDIEMIPMPMRSPHLNPLDHLWRHAKQDVCSDRQYDSLDEEVSAFTNYIYALSPKETLVKAGVYSGNFWLFR